MKKIYKLLFIVLAFSLLTACVKTSEPKDEIVQDDLQQEIIEEEVDENEIFNEEDYVVEEEKEEEKKEENKKEESKKEEDKTESKPKLNKYYIKVNRQTNVVTVYTHDETGNYNIPVKAFVCSTGKNYGTPAGTFKITSKHRWQLMKGDVYSQYASRIGVGHILFHSVPYSKAANDTLKVSYYNKLGVQASAGCVRLTCADAKWIYSNCPSGTVVVIFDGNSSKDPLGKPSAMKLSTNHPCAGWDPTDPDSKNPWKKQPPTITLTDASVIELGSKVDLTKRVKAIDVYGKSLSVTVSGHYDFNKIGTYNLTYTCKDARGNSASLNVVINVKDTLAPDIQYDGVKDYDQDLSNIETYINKHLIYKDISSLKETKVNINIDEDNSKIYVEVIAIDDYDNKNTLEFTINIVKEEVIEPEVPEIPEENQQENNEE